jgi:nitroimidazol reductase NimA-like FMN-containing flavoprotein (pyridoxamine 5'-phosphate oxidase superfamily)
MSAQGEPPVELVELPHEECLALLAGTDLGRVAVNMPGWPPLIRPVHYVFDEGSQSVVFRCARGSKLRALARAQRAAFEVDGEDPAEGSGWSVIVIGPVEEIASAAEVARLERSGLRPGLADAQAHWLRIRATAISGRRVRRGGGP